MSEPLDVSGQVQELLARWNTPAEDRSLELLIGVPAPEGDGRATDHVSSDDAGQTSDNEITYDDDGDDDDDDVEDYADEEVWTFSALKEEIDARNADRDSDDHISKGGSRDDLVARLLEDDGSEDDSEDDD